MAMNALLGLFRVLEPPSCQRCSSARLQSWSCGWLPAAGCIAGHTILAQLPADHPGQANDAPPWLPSSIDLPKLPMAPASDEVLMILPHLCCLMIGAAALTVLKWP